MRNEYPGTCYRCDEHVPAGEGHFERQRSPGRKWRLQHADCAIRWRGQPAPTIEQAKAARQPKRAEA